MLLGVAEESWNQKKAEDFLFHIPSWNPYLNDLKTRFRNVYLADFTPTGFPKPPSYIFRFCRYRNNVIKEHTVLTREK